jgi:imidazolonepropionase-like amidohydrolase
MKFTIETDTKQPGWISMSGLVGHCIAITLALVVIIFTATPTLGQIPAPVQDAPVALIGGDIYLEGGEVIAGGSILFDQGKIVSIGRALSLPTGCQVIDVSGKQVHPGLILSRTSLGLTEISRHAESTDLSEIGPINPNVRAQVAFHPASEHIGVAAVHGITTAVSTPTGGIISGQSAAMRTDGWTWEQMTLKAPAGMMVSWPAMTNDDAFQIAIKTLNETFEMARRYRQVKESSVTKNKPLPPTNLRWEALLPVLDGNLPLFIIANELSQILSAIAWSEQQSLKIVLVGGRDAGYIAGQLAAKDIPVIVSPVIGSPSRTWEAYDRTYSLPRMLYEAGVRFSIGGEPSAAGAYRLSHHAAAAVAFGLPQQKALEAITINAARILGIDHLTGSLEIGKYADIIVTNGNPLDIATRTEMVFIEGRQLDTIDKHRRLYEHYMMKLER